jgi:hypothetical protein
MRRTYPLTSTASSAQTPGRHQAPLRTPELIAGAVTRSLRRNTLMTRPLVIALLLCALTAGSADAATYYVSPSGSDRDSGHSAAEAWRSVWRVNRAALRPGDVVRFAGGATFTDQTLMPGRSGTASAPITFGSYGGGLATISNGRGAVWLEPGLDHLVFDGLRLTSGGGVTVFADSGSAPGSSDITIRNSVLFNSSASAIGSWQPTDTGWRIVNNTITHTGDSAIISFGRGTVISRNRISDVGWNAGIDWDKHGIYSKGPYHVITGNDIRGVPDGQGVSLRFRGARVYRNAIHDVDDAIAFFDYDPGAQPKALSYVYGNKIWNVNGWFFYYSGQRDPQGRVPSVGFVVASNSAWLTGATEAVNVSEERNADVTFANNLVAGSYRSAFRGLAGRTSEHNNAWSGGAFNIPSTASNVRANPRIVLPSFAPAAGSPLVDRGSISIPGLPFRRACDGTPFSFCGSAPEIGAVERGARSGA